MKEPYKQGIANQFGRESCASLREGAGEALTAGNPGRLIGATDAGGTAPTADTVISPDDIGATILNSLGIDHHQEYHTQSGRPVRLIPDGHVIGDLF